ncbi:MAG TPA: Fic family protein [Terriglobales bacterium]|nr:Fic family protein [Terriglobales bacterium]
MPLFTVKSVPDDFLEVIDLIVELRKGLRFALSDERRRWTGILRRSTLAKAIQGSNSIEGYNVNYNDAIAAVDGEEPVDAKHKEWANILGYRQALTYALQLTCEATRVEEATIRAMHFMMLSHDMKAHPGIWRRGAIFVRREPEDMVVYEGPEAELLSSLMREFVASLNDKTDCPVIVKAALAHLNLVMIHPFSDGNGRMGRAIQTLIMAREKIVDPVFSSIEEWLGAHTQPYYDVLEKVGRGSWHPENDPLPFVKFCLVAHFQQAENLLRQNMFLRKVWDAVGNEIKGRNLMDRMSFAVADASIGIKVRNSTYRNQVEISNESASKDLKTLVDNGLLVPKGERKGRYYEASETIKGMVRTAAEQTPRSTRDPFVLIAEKKSKEIQPELPGMPEPAKVD